MTARTSAELCASVRRLAGTHVITLTHTPRWYLVSVEIRVRRKRYHVGRGGRTVTAAVRRLEASLRKRDVIEPVRRELERRGVR